MTDQPDIPETFIASIALEPNRWKKDPDKVPSLRVSEWSQRAREAGFTGWELWEHHFLRADASERHALARSALPVRIFNTYLLPGINTDADWQGVVDAIHLLGDQVRAVKFNLGKDTLPEADQLRAALHWAARLPEHVTLLCECHPGTLLETPAAAAAAFAVWPAPRFQAILHPLGGGPNRCEGWFAALGRRIRHLHWQARDADNRMCALDADPPRLEAAIQVLRANGFSGTQSVEFVQGTGRPGESVPTLFDAAVANLRHLRAAWGANPADTQG
jgi:sugar phosphate isomerase/epimerase